MTINSATDLALYIRNFRKQHKFSQHAIADLVGLKQATISAFENNPASTKLDTLFRILAATKLYITIQSRDAAQQTPQNWNESW